jgi:hypothetical protein
VPLGGHVIDKRQELEEQLNKPFGGKMNFTPNSFNWLIENTLKKSRSYVKLTKDPILLKKVRTSNNLL